MGRSKGYGFITFKEPEAVEEVLKKIHVIDLRQVNPIYATCLTIFIFRWI